MFTTKGDVDEKLLRVKEIHSQAPSGKIVATEYYLEEEMVRRDVKLVVDETLFK